jgi:gas vesicle protein
MPHHDLDLELEADLDHERSSLAPFLLGALVGAGAALLLAPRTGAETRRDLARLLGQAREAGPGGAVEGARAQAAGWVERAREAVDGQVDRLRDAVEEGREAARDAADELRRSLDEARSTYRAGVAGTPPPKRAQPVAPSSASTTEVVVGETTLEEDGGDLAR